MKRKADNDAWRIRFLARRSRKEAVAQYAEKYRRPVDDPSILEDLDKVLSDNEGDWTLDRVSVPIELLVALSLRPSGKGGRPPKEPRARRQFLLAVRIANRIWAEKSKGEGRGVVKNAKHEAAQEAIDQVFSGKPDVDISTIKLAMRLADGRRALDQ
jgi:hypothetical protein